MNDLASSFAEALKSAGLTPNGPPVVDDAIHRFKSGDDKEANSWYVLHRTGDVVIGAFGCWKRDFYKPWCSKQRNLMTPEERRDTDSAIRNARATQEKEEKANHEKVRRKCAEMFAKSPRAESHPYLTKKGVGASKSTCLSTYEVYPGWLAVPLQDIDGTIHSAQFIDETGQHKKYFWQGRVRGCFHQFSDTNHDSPIVICEGYATGASVFMATGWTVICAMTCGNLETVAKKFRNRYPDRKLLIAADDDQWTDGNPGLTHARHASETTKSLLAVPEFADESLADKPTDFNDLHRIAGLREVKRQVHKSFPLLKVLEERLFNPAIRPPESRPIFTLADVCICTPGNLTTITSAIKTGKSAVIGAMCASTMISGVVPDSVTLGFESSNIECKAIVHFDSEQSPEDHWHGVDRIRRRAQLDKLPPWFYSYCLTGLGTKKSLECVLEALRIAREEHPGIHSSFIDGFADLVNDVNDPAECNDFVARMHALAIDYFCSKIGVIHFNPGTEKSRGHLGSQLERKAETNLALEKSPDQITVIYSTKNRRAGIPKRTGPCFEWSDEHKMHVSCENTITVAHGTGRPSAVNQIVAMNTHSFLADCKPQGEGWNEIAKRLELWLAGENIAVSFSTARRAVNSLVGTGKLSKSTTTGNFVKGPNA